MRPDRWLAWVTIGVNCAGAAWCTYVALTTPGSWVVRGLVLLAGVANAGMVLFNLKRLGRVLWRQPRIEFVPCAMNGGPPQGNEWIVRKDGVFWCIIHQWSDKSLEICGGALLHGDDRGAQAIYAAIVTLCRAEKVRPPWIPPDKTNGHGKAH